MVICDGFNQLLPKSAHTDLELTNGHHSTTTTTTNGHHVKSSPFPRPPPQPPARQLAPSDANGLSSSSASTTSSASSNGLSDTDQPSEPVAKPAAATTVNGYKLNKPIVPLPVGKPLPLSTSSSNCNYDNLRNIDSDDSHVTSPDTAGPGHLNGGNSSHSAQRLSTSVHTNGNGHVLNGKTTTTPTSNNSNINHPASAPITDKNLMKSIINKTINSDPKSQSMFTSNESTPVLTVSSRT